MSRRIWKPPRVPPSKEALIGLVIASSMRSTVIEHGCDSGGREPRRRILLEGERVVVVHVVHHRDLAVITRRGNGQGRPRGGTLRAAGRFRHQASDRTATDAAGNGPRHRLIDWLHRNSPVSRTYGEPPMAELLA